MFTVSAPDLTGLVLGQATVLSMRGLEFSHDGRYLLVETTFSDDAAPEQQRKAVSLYDCSEQSHLRIYNHLLGAPELVDVQAAALAVIDGQAKVALAYSLQGVDQGAARRIAWVLDDTILSADLIEQISGEQANASIDALSLSQDGDFLAFETAASNLAGPLDGGLDTNEVADIYGLDLQAQTLQRLSALADGTETGEPATLGDARRLADGRVVVSFSSAGANLAPQDANALEDVLLWSRAPAQGGINLSLLSRNSQGRSASGASSDSVISDAGVVFQSAAADLVSGDGNAAQDLFLKAWNSSALTRLSQQTLENGALLEYDSDVWLGGSSADGRWLIWMSDASALGAELGISQIYLQDTLGGSVRAVSAVNGGSTSVTPVLTLGNESSFYPLISGDGRYLAFSTLALNLGQSDEALDSSVRLMVSISPGFNDAPIGAVTISGSIVRGSTLTASNDLSDANGIPNSGPGALTYQWMANGVEITGATASTLVLAQEHVGRVITVVARYTDNLGTQESVVSAATEPVTGLLEGMVYHWKSHALLSGVQVQAKVGTDALPLPGPTQTAGNYSIGGIPLQGVQLQASRDSSDSGNAVNAADALAALRIAVGLNPNPDPDGSGPLSAPMLSPYQLIAADVNKDGRVTAADALAILRMAVKLPTALPQEWMFVEENRDFWDGDGTSLTPKLTRTASSWNTTIDGPSTSSPVNLVAILKGDVNGSWSPPAGSLDLDVVNPDYFTALAARLNVPTDQWGL